MDVPQTRRDTTVVDDLHGIRVADPYRWLEDTDADETRDWIAAQNQVTEAHLSRLAHRDAIRGRVRSLWDHPRRSVPFRRGRVWFQLRNDGLQDQDVLWVADADDARSEAPADDRWRVLLDPNALSAEGTVSLSGFHPTDDGARIVYGLSEAGSDWRTWRVREVATGEDLADEIPWSKFSPAAWLPGGEAFVYGAYEAPAPGEEFEAANRDLRLKLHRLGSEPAEDPVVYARPDQPEWILMPTVTTDDRWLVVTVARGTDPNTRVHVAPIGPDARPGPVRPLLDEGDAKYHLVGAHDGQLWFSTDRDAPNGRVVRVDPEGDGRLVEVLPETGHRLSEVHLVGGEEGTEPHLVAIHLVDATSRVTVHGLDGQVVREVELPAIGTAGDPHGRGGGFSGSRSDTAFHLLFESFTAPSSVLRHDLVSGTTAVVTPSGLPPGEELVTEQVFVEHDGVRVPLFLVHRADVTPDGRVPTVLWGYGGFDIPVVPQFRTAFRVWAELGGLMAVACLRGGGEYGSEWHDDGRLAHKQHVFDDAVACAEWLTGDGGWTAPGRIGIEGRSNGGLLVGACLIQRPELWGSAVPEVGVLDMLRFHLFTIGWAWTSDYGCADDPEQFRWLYAYSPYHNLVEGICYPATLVTTGDHDDRVVPGHSFKFAAALQHAQGCDRPVLVRVDTSAGHGAGKPVGKLVDERTDVLAFHAEHLGLEPSR